MLISITANEIEVTEAMRNKIKSKLIFMEKFLKEEDTVTIRVKKEGRRFLLKAILPGTYKDIIIKNKDGDFYIGLEILADKIKETYLQDRDRIKSRRKEKSKLRVWEKEEEKTVELIPEYVDSEIEELQFKYN